MTTYLFDLVPSKITHSADMCISDTILDNISFLQITILHFNILHVSNITGCVLERRPHNMLFQYFSDAC